MISVIILSHNSNNTYDCIENLKNNSNNIDEIIVLKTDINTNYSDKNINIKNINIKEIESYSFSKMCNIGIKSTSINNDILILNDNCYGVKNTFENLEKSLYSRPDIGIASPISSTATPHYFQSFNIPFNSITSFEDFVKDKAIYNEEQNELRLRTTFLTVLIKREVINILNGFDELFLSRDYSSDDFCLSALKNGFKTVLSYNSFIYIKGDTYFNLAAPDKSSFKHKWGFDPHYSLTIRNDIVDKLAIDKSKPINILEIGCACGCTLLKLKSIYKDATLYGIDINDKSIEIANCIDGATVLNKDVESEDIVFEENKFDLIVLLDVLEHLRDPWILMKKLKKSLREDGQIIIGLPNIMHISIINNLAHGRWDYEDCGILDRTHLRFFTLKSIKELFQGIGYDNIYYFSIYARLNFEEENLVNYFNKLYNIDSAQLMTYQYIITNKIPN